jgi:hypothetical protein
MPDAARPSYPHENRRQPPKDRGMRLGREIGEASVVSSDYTRRGPGAYIFEGKRR